MTCGRVGSRVESRGLRGRRITLRRRQKMRCMFPSIRRSTSDVSCCQCCLFSANRIVRVAQRGGKVQNFGQAWFFVRCDEIDGSIARNIDFEGAKSRFSEKLIGKRRC